jgi:signal transduction histidine kinase
MKGETRMKSPQDETAPPALELLDAELLAPGLLHELRQPLMGADAAATLLERAAGAELSGREEWTLLRTQLTRLAEVVNGYDALLRADDPDPAPFAVAPVVARAVDLLAHRVRPLARRFALSAGDGPLEGFGAPGALVHAATNLLANALDAIDEAEGEPRLEVRVLAAPGGGVQVRVSDEGVGIPPDVRPRIFEPRFTTKPPGKGTGLGLHIARRLIGRFGGEIHLVDDRDPARLRWAVTEFCIALPPPPQGVRP